jgi:hypothetical protein
MFYEILEFPNVAGEAIASQALPAGAIQTQITTATAIDLREKAID